jgi:hypothetical protein
MKKIMSKLFRRNIRFQDVDREFTISKGLPQPIKARLYKDQLTVVKTLERLSVGYSFPIRNELEYTVRKMARLNYPEYKLIIRNMGTSKRVYRVA